MSYYSGGHLRETLSEAGLKYIECLHDGSHRLLNLSSGKIEIWANSKHHAGYALIYKNTELEFCGEEPETEPMFDEPTLYGECFPTDQDYIKAIT